MRFVRQLALTATLALAAPLAAQEPLHLRFNFETGQSFGLLTVMEQDITQEMMGQQQKMRQEISTGMIFDVQELLADGSVKIRLTYHSLRMLSEGMMGRVEYDSENPPEYLPEQAKPLAAMVGQSLVLTLSPQGDVTEVEGMEEMFDRMLQDMEIPAGMEESLRGNMEQSTGGVAEMFSFFPDHPIRTGESWSNEVSGPSGVPIRLESTYTLRGREEGVALVDVHSTVSPAGDSTMEMGPMTMHYDLSGEQTGNMEIDEATGWTVRSRLEASFSGTVVIEGMDQEISSPMTIRSVMTSGPLPGFEGEG